MVRSRDRHEGDVGVGRVARRRLEGGAEAEQVGHHQAVVPGERAVVGAPVAVAPAEPLEERLRVALADGADGERAQL